MTRQTKTRNPNRARSPQRLKLFAAFALLFPLACSDAGTEPDSRSVAKPDLVVADLRSPAIASPGRQLYVVYRYANHGTATAPATGVHRVFLSQDTAADESDVQLGTVTMEALGAAAFTGDSLTFSLEPDFPEGPYYVILQLDATRLVDELDERNNEAAQPSDIYRGGDLEVEYLSLQTGTFGTPPSEFSISYDFRVLNSGTANVPGYSHRLYISTDSLATDGIELEQCYCWGVGQTARRVFHFSNHDVIAAGRYYGFLVVWPPQNTKELNPTNNARRSRSFEVPSLTGD